MSGSTKKPKVALVQVRWRGSYQENLHNALNMIDDIARRGEIDLICLPEFFAGAPWWFPGKTHLRGILEETIPGRLINSLSRAAAKLDTYILCGSIIEKEGDQLFVTSVLLDGNGNIVGKARKLHRYAAEFIAVEPGEEPLIVDTPFGRLGICVCSDFWIPEMSRLLAVQGAEIICVPGATLAQNTGVTRACVQATSTYNVCYTLYVSPVARVSGQRRNKEVVIELSGHSTIAGPERILSSLKDQEGILYGELDLDYLHEMRTFDPTFRRTLYWCLWGRVPELYGGLTKPYVGIEGDDLATRLSDCLA